MANAPAAQQARLASLYSAARRDSACGVLAQTQKVRLRYWTHWEHFCWELHHLDPFLDGTPLPQQVALLQGFARYVRQGNAGRGHRVQAGSVQDALCAIGKTFELELLPNPVYQLYSPQRYWEPLRAMLSAYRRDDPKSQPQLAVPVAITELLLNQHRANPHHCPHRAAVSDLTNIAFYYLLRVGEYTKPRNTLTNTIPFRVMDITFRHANGRLIPNTRQTLTKKRMVVSRTVLDNEEYKVVTTANS